MRKNIIKLLIAGSILIILSVIIFIRIQNEKKIEQDRIEKIKDINDASVLSLTFFDVGIGDCTIINDADHIMMVDCGSSDYYEKIQDYLKLNNIDKIDKLILTHPDKEHISNAANIIHDYSVDELYMAAIEPDDSYYESLRFAIEISDISVIYPKMNDFIEFGNKDTTYQFLAPHKNEKDSYIDLDSYSLMLKITNLSDSFILGSDGTKEEADEILLRYLDGLKASVYMAADHGSHGNSANTKAFLEALQPDNVIISCSGPTAYPSEELLTYFNNNNIPIYRTDLNGNIYILSTGHGLIIDYDRVDLK